MALARLTAGPLLISQDDFLNGWERRGEGQQDGPKLLKHLPMAPMKNTQ